MKDILSLLVFLIASMGIFSQEIDDRLLVFGEAKSSSIKVQWQPMDADYWDSLNSIGYRLERVEIDAQGVEDPSTRIVLAGSTVENRMYPKDTLWFEENAFELDGLIDAMGALLYDTTFQFPENQLLDANTMRYNFLLYEAQWKPLAGEALGLMYQDTSVQYGKSYRYTVSASINESIELKNNIDFTAKGYQRKRSPEGLYPAYEFPTRMPLSMMISSQIKKRRDRIVAQSRAYEDSIVVRWAPNSAEFWLEANDVGYFIIRSEEGVEDSRDTIAHVMPWALDQLSENEAALTDEMALIAANNLHGSNVKTVEGDFIEQAQAFQNRYGFSLYAAEQSGLAGDILGLRFVDKQVTPDRNYDYQIICPASNSILAKANVRITNTFVPQPSPVDLKLVQGDQYLILEWSLENRTRFSSYNLERSDDGGKTFFPLTEEPLVFLETEEIKLERFNFLDSVENYVERIYRLSGNDSFSETSTPAEVRGMSVDLTPPPQPSIISAALNDTKDSIFIEWATPPLTDDFVGYKVLFGGKGEGPYEELTDLLPREVESFVYTGETLDGRQSHYFKISSVDTAQNVANSIEYFVAVPDLIRPEPPARMEGYIEDDGTVKLAWEQSVSEDAVGYWLYFANNPKDEFAVVHEGVLSQNSYTYKIQETFLNEEIYYVVATKDEAGNKSKLSEVLAVKRPDKVPPQKPVLKEVNAEENTLVVDWVASVSDDVEWYFIEKRTFGEIEWMLIDSVASDREMVFEDPNCRLEQFYEYRVRAKDDAGWYSEYPLPIKGKVPFKPELFSIKDLTVTFDKEEQKIKLNWNYEPPQVNGWDYPYQFSIHKAFGRNNVDSFKLVSKDEFSFSDAEFEPESLYKYAIRIQFENGKSGALSPVKSVFAK